MNSLDRLAASTRAERLAVGNSTSVIPWLSPGQTVADGGAPPEDTDPGVALFNALLQVFASGATGFHLYTHNGFVDMSMWLAVREAIAMVTPYEDVIMDGTPAPDGTFSNVAPAAVLSAMTDTANASMLLIASSTLPYGRATAFTVHGVSGGGWLLCDLSTNKSVAAGSDGSATCPLPLKRAQCWCLGLRPSATRCFVWRQEAGTSNVVYVDGTAVTTAST